MTPDEYCRERAARSGSSFYFSFFFLPPERRRAITALYAFCREVDDVVDECREPSVARIKLDWWSEEVERAFADTPRHPVTQALAPALAAYGLPRRHFDEILEGMGMDLDAVRYGTFDELKRYCYHVASTVGLLAARIFGYSDERTLGYAHDLGIAFQLTNIIRDVGEDAARGRVYLPRDELLAAGLDADDILQRRAAGGEALRRLMADQIDRAYVWYDRALAQLPAADRKSQRPGLIMAAIYRTVLTEIRSDGCRVLEHRIALPPARKLWLACRTALAA